MTRSGLLFVILLGCQTHSLEVVPVPRETAPVDAGQDAPTPCRDAKGLWHMPNPVWTPGKFCSQTDPNFEDFRYAGHVAYCKRNVPQSEKTGVATLYGIPKSDWSLYEFDHFLPLNAGGSDEWSNIWPQPLAEAHEKDKVEDEVYLGLKNGTMTQAEAEAKIRAWRPSMCP